MQRLLDQGLEDLTVMVYRMGKVAEKTLSISISGFVEGKDVSEDVHELSEILVNKTLRLRRKLLVL